MALIESEPEALRLANAIAADIALYHSEKIRTGADLSEEIEEGRALFRSRVAESFYAVYDRVIEEKIRGSEAMMMPSSADFGPGPIQPKRSGNDLATTGFLVLAAIGGVMWIVGKSCSGSG